MKKIIPFIVFAVSLPAFFACCGKHDKQASQMSNPVIESIYARRSVRQYTDQKVPREILQTLAECGVNAPNAMNKQQWEVRIIDSEDYFNALTDVMEQGMPGSVNRSEPGFRNVLRNASAAIAIACPDDDSGMSLINVGLFCENVCLAAQSLGLGSVVMAGPVWRLHSIPEAKTLIDRLGFSEGYKLRIFVGLGYPAEAPEAKPRDLDKIRFIE